MTNHWPDTNLGYAQNLVDRIAICQSVQRELKAAFAGDELDGGYKTALTHPLYIRAQESIDFCRERLKLLV